MATRAEVRAGIDYPQRVILLENDADTFEASHKRIEGLLTRLVYGAATGAVGLAVNAALLYAQSR